MGRIVPQRRPACQCGLQRPGSPIARASTIMASLSAMHAASTPGATGTDG